MAKTSPDKLALALRANLKRRKEKAAPKRSKPTPKPAAQPPKN
jgi:hypothetical protein